jgi:hypothetical protein
MSNGIAVALGVMAVIAAAAWWNKTEQREQSASYAKCIEEGLYDCSKVYDWRVN